MDLTTLKPLPIFDEERDVLRPCEKPSLLEWMENNYYLEGGTSAVPGLWSKEYTPYFAEPAAWFSDTTTREIWIMACSQSGKTTFETGISGYICDCMPGPTLLIMPTKDDVKNRVEARIRPMFKSNDNLLRHVYGRERNILIGKQTVMDHMILYIGWPTSADALADKPVCYDLADEVGKYPANVGKEADPISLMRKRQRWFKSRSKLLGASTPVIEDDMFDQEWKRGDCCQWNVPCPHCGKWHQIDWEYVQIDKKVGTKEFYEEKYYRSGKRARYVCPKCGSFWSEDDRWKAVCGGKFVPKGCTIDDNGNISFREPQGSAVDTKNTIYRSCRIHALMLHPMVETVTSLVMEFVHANKAKHAGIIGPLKDFWNSQLARPWRETKAETEIHILQKHIGSYERLKVPPGVQMITQGFDVQLDHVYRRVLGWGYLGEFWSIHEERIETGPTDVLANLKKIIPAITQRFELMADDKKVMRIAISAIDSSYNTETVNSLCLHVKGIANLVPIAGDDKVNKQAYKTHKTAGGELIRYDLNLLMYKDALFRAYFEAVKGGPGYGHLHKDTEYVVLEHLTSEHKDIIRAGTRIKWIGWLPKVEGRANHYWDCDVYARAAADIGGLWTIPDPDATKQEITYAGKHPAQKPIRTRY